MKPFWNFIFYFVVSLVFFFGVTIFCPTSIWERIAVIRAFHQEIEPEIPVSSGTPYLSGEIISFPAKLNVDESRKLIGKKVVIGIGDKMLAPSAKILAFSGNGLGDYSGIVTLEVSSNEAILIRTSSDVSNITISDDSGSRLMSALNLSVREWQCNQTEQKTDSHEQ